MHALLDTPGIDADMAWRGNTDCTALSLWCEKGDMTLIRRLVEEHACDPEHKNEGGCTCLWLATKHGHREVVRYLLQERHVNPNVPNRIMHSTPLFVACEKGFLEIARLLKQHGADPNIRMHDGDTVIHCATTNRHLAVVRQLLEWGCSPNVVDNDRQTPIKIAVQTGRLSLVRMLLDAGAGKTLCVGGAEIGTKNGGREMFPLNAIEAAGYCFALTRADGEDAEPEYDLGTPREVKKPFEIAETVAREMIVLAPDLIRGGILGATKKNITPIMEIMAGRGVMAMGLSDGKRTPAEFKSVIGLFSNIVSDLPVNIDEYCVSPALVDCSRKPSAAAYCKPALSKNLALSDDKPPAEENLQNSKSSRSTTAPPSASSGEDSGESSAQVRARGNDALKKGDFAEALRLYEAAMALDPTCALAASNAAEAALRLQRPNCAREHALAAFGLDRAHEKTWSRLVRSLARLQRAAEAYVWIADRVAEGLFGEQSALDLTALVSTESPLCFGFKKGLYLCQAPASSVASSRSTPTPSAAQVPVPASSADGQRLCRGVCRPLPASSCETGSAFAGGYAVRTAVAIAAKETLTQERAVVLGRDKWVKRAKVPHTPSPYVWGTMAIATRLDAPM